MSNKKTKENKEKEEGNKTKDGGFYERRPIEEIKVFKSKDGKSFVFQTITTCIFPTNYIRAIVKNESPYKAKVGKKEVEA